VHTVKITHFILCWGMIHLTEAWYVVCVN